MAQRTTPDQVQAVLGANYGINPDGTFPDLQQYIDTAWPMVDQALALAASNNRIIPNAVQQEIMERWLSAYFYTMMDPLYTSKSNQSSGSFVTEKFDPNRYKQAAIQVDPSGCLNALLNRLVATGDWLGKPVSAQIPIDQRS